MIGAGTLGGGALLPATDGAAGLWREYLQGFHPTGIGSPTVTPPYVAIVAALATVLLGKAWLAVDVLLLGSVPIAGMAALPRRPSGDRLGAGARSGWQPPTR